MVAKDQDFEMCAGDDKYLEFTVLTEAGTVVNLTDCDVEWYLKESADSATALVTKTSEVGGDIAITDPTGGIFQVALDPEDTEDLVPDKYFHGARITDTSSEIYTVAIGHATIFPRVAPAPGG